MLVVPSAHAHIMQLQGSVAETEHNGVRVDV